MAGEIRVAIPAQRTARFLLWNETWSGELGFDTSPDTPDDFKQQSCRAQQSMLKDESAQNDFMGGWYVDTEPMTAYAWLLTFGGKCYCSDVCIKMWATLLWSLPSPLCSITHLPKNQ